MLSQCLNRSFYATKSRYAARDIDIAQLVPDFRQAISRRCTNDYPREYQTLVNICVARVVGRDIKTR